MKKKGTRIIIRMSCTEYDCKHDYVTTKNKKNHPERLVLKKYCPGCNIHAPFTETKI